MTITISGTMQTNVVGQADMAAFMGNAALHATLASEHLEWCEWWDGLWLEERWWVMHLSPISLGTQPEREACR